MPLHTTILSADDRFMPVCKCVTHVPLHAEQHVSHSDKGALNLMKKLLVCVKMSWHCQYFMLHMGLCITEMAGA